MDTSWSVIFSSGVVVYSRATYVPLSPVYTIQPVVNRLSNWFDNRLYRVYKHSTGCQTRLITGLITGSIVYTAGCRTGCTTRFDNRLNEQWLFVQPVVKTVVQPVIQPV